MPYNFNNYNRKRNNRPDHQAGHRQAYERNRKRILASQDICGICGKPVNKKLKYPDLMCATVDHIIPVSKGGHPSDIDNLQLAHFICNRQKSDKIKEAGQETEKQTAEANNRDLPWSMDWKTYRAKE